MMFRGVVVIFPGRGRVAKNFWWKEDLTSDWKAPSLATSPITISEGNSYDCLVVSLKSIFRYVHCMHLILLAANKIVFVIFVSNGIQLYL